MRYSYLPYIFSNAQCTRQADRRGRCIVEAALGSILITDEFLERIFR